VPSIDPTNQCTLRLECSWAECGTKAQAILNALQATVPAGTTVTSVTLVQQGPKYTQVRCNFRLTDSRKDVRAAVRRAIETGRSALEPFDPEAQSFNVKDKLANDGGNGQVTATFIIPGASARRAFAEQGDSSLLNNIAFGLDTFTESVVITSAEGSTQVSFVMFNEDRSPVQIEARAAKEFADPYSPLAIEQKPVQGSFKAEAVSTSDSSKSSGVSSGGVAAIIVGAVCMIALVAVVAGFIIHRRNAKQSQVALRSTAAQQRYSADGTSSISSSTTFEEKQPAETIGEGVKAFASDEAMGATWKEMDPVRSISLEDDDVIVLEEYGREEESAAPSPSAASTTAVASPLRMPNYAVPEAPSARSESGSHSVSIDPSPINDVREHPFSSDAAPEDEANAPVRRLSTLGNLFGSRSGSPMASRKPSTNFLNQLASLYSPSGSRRNLREGSPRRESVVASPTHSIQMELEEQPVQPMVFDAEFVEERESADSHE
jgi:hypothetical protein